MRVVVILAWVAAVALLVLPLLKGRVLQPRTRTTTDVLVKDPVCQTYIVRSRAVAVTHAGTVRHFCSSRCAERFALDRR